MQKKPNQSDTSFETQRLADNASSSAVQSWLNRGGGPAVRAKKAPAEEPAKKTGKKPAKKAQKAAKNESKKWPMTPI